MRYGDAMLNPLSITIVNIAIFFGHYVIISSALNFQFGNAGIPNMGSNLSVAVGAYSVSSIVIRICFWIGTQAGIIFKPDLVYDSGYNVLLLNDFFEAKPILSLSLFLLSLALAFVFGSLLGWLMGTLGGRLRATRLMILLLIVSEMGRTVAANNTFIASGTIGTFIPNFFAWYNGENMIIIAVFILLVGLVGYSIIRTMLNSPFGRLMRAVRDNEITLSSAGKRVDQVRREVMMFGSGMMALSGVLISFYYSFVQYQMYDRVSYTFWPWLMITIGGLGNNAGGFMGTMICVTILKGISLFKQTVAFSLIGSAWLRLISEIMDVFLSLFLLYFMIFKPRGLVPEKNINIPGIKYLDLVYDKD